MNVFRFASLRPVDQVFALGRPELARLQDAGIGRFSARPQRGAALRNSGRQASARPCTWSVIRGTAGGYVDRKSGPE